ncbi:MAG: LysM peptidoglycan-binding domain-containing protein [Vitreimonas sp.]
MSQSIENAIPRGAFGGEQSAQERVHAAMELLDRGEQARAHGLLESALRQEPGNATAQRLIAQIDGDPRRAVGSRTRAYVVRENDTMTGLAERFLGDPLMFYALARYNNMVPNQLAAGQTIQVPDRARPTISASVRAPSPPSASDTAPVAPPASAASANVAARASQLRLRGLERLNAGDADGAVALLGQAHAIDAGNSAIQSDLSRAQRIQASLRTH